MMNTTAPVTIEDIASIIVRRSDAQAGEFTYGASAVNRNGRAEFYDTEVVTVADDHYHGDAALKVLADRFGADVDLDDLEYTWVDERTVQFWL